MLCLCGLDRLHRSQEKKRMTMFERKTYGRFFASLRMTTAALRMTAMLGIVAALWSCAKVSDDRSGEQMPVTFSTYGLRLTGTKAGASYVAPGADFAAGSVVGVYGFYHDNSTFATDTDNIPDFMYNTALTKQDDGTWTYSPIKYWPNEYGDGAYSTGKDRLSFWGYYPRNAEGLSLYESGTTTAYDNATPGIPKAAFTVNSDISQQVDLLFSLPEKDLTKPGINESVQLKFRHALTLLQFNITTSGGSLPEGAVVTIKAISLTNVNSYGICNDPSASISSDLDAAGYWTSVGTPVTISLPDASSDANLILMPQTLAQEGSTGHSAVKLALTYDIKFPAADNPAAFITYSDNETEAYLWRDTAPAYGVKTWLPGRKYIYNMTAGLDEIEFSEVFTEVWTLESTTNL